MINKKSKEPKVTPYTTATIAWYPQPKGWSAIISNGEPSLPSSRPSYMHMTYRVGNQVDYMELKSAFLAYAFHLNSRGVPPMKPEENKDDKGKVVSVRRLYAPLEDILNKNVRDSYVVNI